MSLSDCEKCWDTPCVCGWGYREMSKEKRIELASVILSVNSNILMKVLKNIIPEYHKMKNKI